MPSDLDSTPRARSFLTQRCRARATPQVVGFGFALTVATACVPSPVPAQLSKPAAPQAPSALPHLEAPYGAVISTPGDEVLARADLTAYHGWIKYLQFQASHAGERESAEQGEQAGVRLVQWTQRILDNPGLLAELRGVHEWAYESSVDGSGQPFQINIPTDYSANQPLPLAMYMHGYSGNHAEHADYMEPHEGYFDLSVLGRSRGGGYVALSEADALGALQYVQQQWAVDPRRVHLTGGSMGGGGTFWLASRYPHRFASARPVCGFASDKPMGNLLSVPLYATHSDDDYRVPIAHVRGPLARLAALGGQTVFDETTGYGHAVWNYKEGNERGQQWAFARRLPESRGVQRLDFTALDGQAMRAWWAEIVEWGERPQPARFVAQVGDDNSLQLQVANVSRLQIDLTNSPLDPSRPLKLQFSGRPLVVGKVAPDISTSPVQWVQIEPAALQSPLVLEINRSSAGQLSIRQQTERPTTPLRLHTPGGPNQLYNGEPLLIVYGTLGDDAMNRALAAGAQAASMSSQASFAASNGDLAADGVAHNFNLYGNLRAVPDHAVSAEQLRANHLVLLGTAAQNSVVRDLQANLPAQFTNDAIEFSDGVAVRAEQRALALTYYNPLSPGRLLYWVASHQPQAYAAGASITLLAGDRLSGADAVVAQAAGAPQLVMARSLDSRWKWHSRGEQGTLPALLAEPESLAIAQAEAARVASGADFALASWDPKGRERTMAIAAGTTRLSDLAAVQYFEPLQHIELTGEQLLQVQAKLSGRSQGIYPAASADALELGKVYRVAISASQLWGFGATTQLAPPSVDAGMTLAEAIEQTGLRNLSTQL